MGEDFVVCALGILSSYGSPLQPHSLSFSLSFSSSLFFIFVLLFHATHTNRYFSLPLISLSLPLFHLLSIAFWFLLTSIWLQSTRFFIQFKTANSWCCFLFVNCLELLSDFQFFKIVNFLIKCAKGSDLHFREGGEWTTGEKWKCE